MDLLLALLGVSVRGIKQHFAAFATAASGVVGSGSAMLADATTGSRILAGAIGLIMAALTALIVSSTRKAVEVFAARADKFFREFEQMKDSLGDISRTNGALSRTLGDAVAHHERYEEKTESALSKIEQRIDQVEREVAVLLDRGARNPATRERASD